MKKGKNIMTTTTNTYIVTACELVIYRIPVEAKTEVEAEQKVYDLEELDNYIFEYDGFQIDSIDLNNIT